VKPPRPRGRSFEQHKRRNPPKHWALSSSGEDNTPFLPVPRDGAAGRRRVIRVPRRSPTPETRDTRALTPLQDNV